MSHEENGFIGSWRVTLYPDAGTDSHIVFASLIVNGILVTSPPPVEHFPLTPGGIVYVGAGHGMWQETSTKNAALTFNAQSMDGNGDLVGVGTVSASLELGADGQELNGRYAFEMADPQGEVLATEDGTVRFTRIVVKAAPASTTGAQAAA